MTYHSMLEMSFSLGHTIKAYFDLSLKHYLLWTKNATYLNDFIEQKASTKISILFVIQALFLLW